MIIPQLTNVSITISNRHNTFYFFLKNLRERNRKKRLCSHSVFRPILNSLLRTEEAAKSGGKRKGKRLLIKKQHSEYQKSKSVNSFRLTDCHAVNPNAPYPVPHPVPHPKRKYETALPPARPRATRSNRAKNSAKLFKVSRQQKNMYASGYHRTSSTHVCLHSHRSAWLLREVQTHYARCACPSQTCPVYSCAHEYCSLK